MKGNRLLENLNQELGSKIPMRRYSLADIISESYKLIYDCEDGSNLKKLAESHLKDVKTNPRDIERLSRQLSIIKEMKNLTESGELKDEDLVDKKAYDTVEPNKDRVIQNECNESAGDWEDFKNSKDYDTAIQEWAQGMKDEGYEPPFSDDEFEMTSACEDAYKRWQKGSRVEESRSPRRTRRPMNESFGTRVADWYDRQYSKMMGANREYGSQYSTIGTEAPTTGFQRRLNTIDSLLDKYDTPENNGDIDKMVDSMSDEDKATISRITGISESRRPVKESCATKKKPIQESDDTDLTDEELEELTKHLDSIRKNRKDTTMSEAEEPETPTRRGVKCHLADSKSPKKEINEEANPEQWVAQYGVDILYTEGQEDLESRIEFALEKAGLSVLGCQSTDATWSKEEYEKLIGYKIGESKKVKGKRLKESKSYRGLQNFKKQSEGKAFYKTFKKMHGSLKEGKALTRQESIDLYKASNSALTQLSIELEHNPEFLDTFKESVTILSQDVTSLLESLTRGKAPSKKTMKSLAKFSEALLFESAADQVEQYIRDLASKNDMFLDDLTTPDIEDAAMNGADFDELGEMYAEIAVYNVLGSAGGNNYQEYENALSRAKKVIIELNDMYESKKVNEAENEEIPVEETPEEDFVGDDEGYVQSEEADAFDQEYADARQELNDKLADEYADSEDEFVQSKIETDRVEVAVLKGEDPDEAAAEEEAPEEPEGDDIEDEPEEEEADDSDITDDELEELKKHLKEMRSAKKGN